MSKAKKISIITVAILLTLTAILFATGKIKYLVLYYAQPHHGWQPERNAAAPDYSDSKNWAALPNKGDLTDGAPTGVMVAKNAPVDVFFIHPTAFLNGMNWNSTMDVNSITEENTQWMMINQASTFNGCCNVFAPRFREASIFRYFTATDDLIEKSMNLAYSDVERAFDYFLEHHSKGRPFIIASHSQGTDHGFRLVAERIDGTALQNQMVAAYLIGSTVKAAAVDNFTSLQVCNSANQTGCVIHWATFGDKGSPAARHDGSLCVNPLSWQRDGGRVEAIAHQGAVDVSGEFTAKYYGDDQAIGTIFEPLTEPVPAMTWAECKGGMLYVKDMDGTIFNDADLGGKNYHGLDYPLFHMDIRNNAKVRVDAFLATKLAEQATLTVDDNS